MDNKAPAQEWIQFSKMDLATASHLYDTMRPAPLEIICFHCQQAAEKALKAFLISQGAELSRTHDLGLLAEYCQQYTEISDELREICDDLSPYGVGTRYPQEAYIEQRHADNAITQAKRLCDWLYGLVES